MITAIIIVITVLVSIRAFKDHALTEKLIFHPPSVKQGEWYRLFSYGVLHADYAHLIFNMFTLYFFGMDIERVCRTTLGEIPGSFCFILLYLSALLVAILPTYFKHRENSSYFGLGASGAVSAIIFAYMLINPMNFMGILFIPIYLPAFLFGIIFLLISLALDRKQTGGDQPFGTHHRGHIRGSLRGRDLLRVGRCKPLAVVHRENQDRLAVRLVPLRFLTDLVWINPRYT